MIFDERNYLIEEPFNRAFNNRNRLGTLNWLITVGELRFMDETLSNSLYCKQKLNTKGNLSGLLHGVTEHKSC